jgi:cellulose synthase/poly-beta-1,6-N-acetylglucosamine synthase-like glycosyltransferase
MQLIDILYVTSYAIMIYCSILWFSVLFFNRKKLYINHSPKKQPKITFIIPAYNEEKNIGRCIESILSLNYPKEKIKIVVVDDGSTDGTSDAVKRHKSVMLIKQKNRGKAAALNNGLGHVNTEMVVCLDGDSFVERDYLNNILGYAEEEDVVAVTPAMKVIRTDSLLRKIQWMEYLFSIFLRKVFSIFDCQYVVPGPGSLYKTSVLKKIGGFDENSNTEDMEIAFRFIDKGYRIENSIEAYVHTNTPNDFWGLYKQRIRWYTGYLRNVKKYSHMVGNIKYGNMGIFLLPINFVWMIILGFMLVSFGGTFLILFYDSLVNWGYINYGMPPINLELDIVFVDFYLFFGILFFIMSLIIIWLSVYYSGEKMKLRKRLVHYLSFMFIYPFLLSIFWILSILYEIFGVKKKW